jgi:uncharacterized membrane protein
MLPRVPIVLLTALGAVLRFTGIGHQGFWYDEAYTAYLVRYDPGRMLGLLPHLESTPPLYYCVAWVWVRVFGDDPAGLKSLSAVFGTLTIPVVYWCAQKFHLNRRATLIATALTACNPMLIWYSQEARAYSMLVFMCVCTLLAFAWALERPAPLSVAAWALISALALTTHYYAALVVVPELVWLLHVRRHALAVRFGAAGVLATGLALLPLLIVQSRSHNDAWIGHVSLLERLDQVLPMFLLGPETHLRDLVKYLAFAAALVGLASLICWSRSRERQAASIPAVLALVALLLAVTAGERTLLARNLLPILVPLTLVIAAGLGASRARLTGIAATLVLCGVGVFATVSVASDYKLQRPNWQKLAVAMGPWPDNSSDIHEARIVIVQDNPGALPLGLYLKDLRYDRTATLQRVREIDVIAVRHERGLGGFCWWGSACNLVPSHLRRTYRIPGFHIVRRIHVEQFDVQVLRADKPLTVMASSLPTAPAEKRRHYLQSGRAKLRDAHLVQQT